MFHEKGVFGTPMQTGLGVLNLLGTGTTPQQIPRPTFQAPAPKGSATKTSCPKGEWRCAKSSGPDQCDKWLWYCPTTRIGTKLVTRTQKIGLRLPAALPPQVKTTMLTLGSSMGIPTIGGMPQIGFEERDGLWYVQPMASPILLQMLAAMKYQPYQPAEAMMPWQSDSGSASVVVGQPGDASTIVQGKLASGKAVLVNKASLASGTPQFVFTSSSADVAKLASGAAATHASLYDQPDAVLGPAETIATQPGSAAAMFASIPKWAIPVGLGVLALGVGAVVLSKRKG
jgi:hypothetical protein